MHKSSNGVITNGLSGKKSNDPTETTPLILQIAEPKPITHAESEEKSNYACDKTMNTLCCASILGLGMGLPSGLLGGTLVHALVPASFFSCFGGYLGYSLSDECFSPRPR